MRTLIEMKTVQKEDRKEDLTSKSYKVEKITKTQVVYLYPLQLFLEVPQIVQIFLK